MDARKDDEYDDVLIGIRMDEASLRAGLERCLLTDAEMKLGPSQWRALPDPFASWGESVGEPSMVA